jgi:hypothetical protein
VGLMLMSSVSSSGGLQLCSTMLRSYGSTP